MTKRKIAIAIAAAALAGTCAIGGTLAWLTATDDVTNTFTVGNVDLTVSETTGTDTSDGKNYTILPGVEFEKDPTITVTGVESYVFVKITQTPDADTGLYVEPTEISDGWESVYTNTDDSTKVKTTIYRYTATVTGGDTGTALDVFEKAILSSEYEAPETDEDGFTADIKIEGYAIQADGLPIEGEEEPWESAYDELGLPVRE